MLFVVVHDSFSGVFIQAKLHTDTPVCQASVCDMDTHFGQDESAQLRMFVAK